MGQIDLSINVKRDRPDRIPVVVLVGPLDIYTAPTLKDTVRHLIEAGEHRLVIEMGGVHSTDTQGLGALAVARREFAKLNGGIGLVIPENNPKLWEVIKTTRLDKTIYVSTTIEETIAMMTTPRDGQLPETAPPS